MIVLLLAVAAPPQVRMVVEPPASLAAAREGVTVFALNQGDTPAQATPPPRIDAITVDGGRIEIVPVDAAPTPVAAGGFATLRYRLSDTTLARLEQEIATGPTGETRIATAQGTASGFLDRFEAHEPIYGVFGFGSDGAKLQFSLAVRPFDGAGVLDDVRVAWTQTMFWAIDQSSGPFRSTNYSPEVYYQRSITPALSAAGGYAHDSNGRGDVGSIDVNRLYLAASYALSLGDDWQAEVSPKLWSYVGTGYRDLDRYWGHWSLGAAIGQTDGLKLAGRLRNPLGTRRAGELQLSYPLTRIGGGTALYLFGQAFSGYGEAIDDYRLRTSTARIGVSFTR